MIFSRKGRLRMEYNERLLHSIEAVRAEWLTKKELIENSLEPSEQVLYEVKLAKAKYFFLLREAKIRNLRTRSF
ncbi:YaaL family protein [Pseudalkalibacillus salsuginis]|uniref:YaaL family protein n=1 Tax=Pseudalkalibacillus salsuginis TaxID=2910972 RepID=UPI001F2A666C|nr:YaaL family protein [Pseudalkalibacillus salsuginis]MCF6411979.1 YaaL family protein [Pseudalkalibacillus salsuginis]